MFNLPICSVPSVNSPTKKNIAVWLEPVTYGGIIFILILNYINIIFILEKRSWNGSLSEDSEKIFSGEGAEEREIRNSVQYDKKL
jgi:hypothetical protein